MKKVIILLVLLSLLYFVNTKQQQITDRRFVLLQSTSAKNLPVELALTQMVFGGMKGIINNYLWVRLLKLQEEKRFFEAYQLATFIIKLDPRQSDAQIYLAWNAAYNISVVHEDYLERWKWVKKGISLLRDHAMQYNENPDLYEELASIYQFKIGDIMDDAHKVYKRQLSLEMDKVFGSRTNLDFERMSKCNLSPTLIYAFFQKNNLNDILDTYLNKHKMSFDEFIFKLNSYYKNDLPSFNKLVENLPSKKAKSFLKKVFSLAKNKPYNLDSLYFLIKNKININFIELEEYYSYFLEYGTLPYEINEKLSSLSTGDYNTVFLVVEDFFRQKNLVERYKFEIQTLIQLDAKYNKMLDWRLPYTHSLYWSSLGLAKLKQYNKSDLQCVRTKLQALKDLYYYGILLSYKHQGKNLILNIRNLKFASFYLEEFERIVNPTEHGKHDEVYNTFVTGKKFMLIDFCVQFALENDNEKAEKYYKILQKEYPEYVGNRTYKNFVFDEMVRDFHSQDLNSATNQIAAKMLYACQLILFGKRDKAMKHFKIMNKFYTKYVNKEISKEAGRDMPSLKDILQSIIIYQVENAALKDIQKQLLIDFLKEINYN